MTIPEISLHGPGRERGRIHGESLRDQIAAALDDWYESLSTRANPQELLADFTRTSGLREAAEQHSPDLVEEVWGLAEGSDQSFEAMFAYQGIDEVWWYLDDLTGGFTPVEHCSAFAINKDGHGFLGQTQDLPRHYDGHQVMLRYLEPDGTEMLVPSIAGLLALNGVNSHGLAVGITTLSQLAHSGDGLASGFLVPSLLRCQSIDSALDLLTRTPIASGNSFMLGTRERSVVVEVSADAMQVLDHGDQALHTNHTLGLDPVFDYVRFEGSVERLEQIQAAIPPGATLEQIQETYAGGVVCRPRAGGDPIMSVGTMVFELGDEQVCHFAPGPLDTDDLVPYRMTGS